MIEVTLVPQDQIETIWPQVEDLIERALPYNGGRFRLGDVFIDLMNGHQSLWLALDEGEIIGCTTIRVTQYPTGLRVLSYEYLAGKAVHRWLAEGHRVCSAYAKDVGCTVLDVPYGRSGWAHFLTNLGYRQSAVRYELNLED